MSTQSVVHKIIEKRTAWLNEIATQDNRATALPIVIALQQRREYPARDGYDSDGEWPANKEHGTTEPVPYKIHWEDFQHFFTYSAMDEHMRRNGHNVGVSRSFVKHAFRNTEWSSIPVDFQVLMDYIKELELRLPERMVGPAPEDFDGWWAWWNACRCGLSDHARLAASNAWYKQQHKIEALEAEIKLLKGDVK